MFSEGWLTCNIICVSLIYNTDHVIDGEERVLPQKCDMNYILNSHAVCDNSPVVTNDNIRQTVACGQTDQLEGSGGDYAWYKSVLPTVGKTPIIIRQQHDSAIFYCKWNTHKSCGTESRRFSNRLETKRIRVNKDDALMLSISP